MKRGEINIRPVRASDNEALASIIRDILDELDVPREGTTYADKELDQMFETFSSSGAAYFVVEEGDRILGGAGIIHLREEAPHICELQKMYLLPETRGRGIGKQLLSTCLKAASNLGYKSCYLETMSDMHIAQQLYIKAGFTYLNSRMGATGHYVCPIWMIKELD